MKDKIFFKQIPQQFPENPSAPKANKRLVVRWNEIDVIINYSGVTQPKVFDIIDLGEDDPFPGFVMVVHQEKTEK